MEFITQDNVEKHRETARIMGRTSEGLAFEMYNRLLCAFNETWANWIAANKIISFYKEQWDNGEKAKEYSTRKFHSEMPELNKVK